VNRELRRFAGGESAAVFFSGREIVIEIKNIKNIQQTRILIL